MSLLKPLEETIWNGWGVFGARSCKECSWPTKYKQTNKLRGLSPQARTIPTERPPLVGQVSTNFSGERVSCGQRNESPTVVNFGFLTKYNLV
jgi:hypothetical protein